MFKLLPIIFITLHGVQSMINGLYAASGDFPFVAAVLRFNLYHCNGILINEFKVLTAAHILDGIFDPTELSVVIGEAELSNDADAAYVPCRVRAIYRHPNFAQYIPHGANERFFLNDMAVLKLFYKIYENPYIGWASLMNTEAPWGPMSDCSIISWTRSSPEHMKLMWDKVKYVSDEMSHLWGTYLLPNQKSFNDLFDHDLISSDDIGSPIVCNNQVIGLVVKGGQHNQPTKPSILLLVYNYLEFIWEVMADGVFDIHPWKFPYVATVWNLRMPECGGFIVNENHIVTTGYCANRIDETNGRVTVGHEILDMNDLNTNWLLIENIVKHPEYNVRYYHWPIDEKTNDIAVITLAESLVWSPTIQPLTVGESNNAVAGEVCQVLRWITTPLRYKQKSRKLLQITLKRSLVIIWDEKQLECMIEKTENTSIWARTPYVMPIAEMIDGGNPLICRGYPVGMVLQDSTPRNWNGPKSARFLKLQEYSNFIDTVIGKT